MQSSPWWLSDHDLACLHNVPAWPPSHWVRSICSPHSKRNPSRASDKGFYFLSSRHTVAVNCFPLNKPDTQGTCLSSFFKSLASHKLGQRNASQALRARCVVGGGELVVGCSPSVVVRMTVIVWLQLGQKVYCLVLSCLSLPYFDVASLSFDCCFSIWSLKTILVVVLLLKFLALQLVVLLSHLCYLFWVASCLFLVWCFCRVIFLVRSSSFALFDLSHHITVCSLFHFADSLVGHSLLALTSL